MHFRLSAGYSIHVHYKNVHYTDRSDYKITLCYL